MKRIQLKRRGIVLLVVLSLLALFTIFAVSFLLVSGQYRTAAAINVRTQRTTTPPDRFAEEALMQLLRDTTERSALRNHSLLNDLYGSDGVAGQVVSANATAISGSTASFVQIQARQASLPSLTLGFTPLPGYYSGRVITFIEGAFQGKSCRIVNSDVVPSSPAIQVITFEWPDDTLREISATPLPAIDDRFIINGQPFNGMGHGYDPSPIAFSPGNGNLTARFQVPTAQLPDGSAALMPNSMAGFVPPYVPDFFKGMNTGGADESWDTFDYQNMFLAMVPPDLKEIPRIIPSFHRPELIEFWFNAFTATEPALSSLQPNLQRQYFFFPYGSDHIRDNGNDAPLPLALRDKIVDILRACTLRPLPEDHPNFKWNNQDFHPLGNFEFLGGGDYDGRWDVDNDGDGIADSIWIDIGLPAQTAPDGKRFRPLVAILCQDLDGRLDLNSHGQDSSNVPLVKFHNSRFMVEDPSGDPISQAYANGSSLALPRGRGTGPAEISLAPLVLESTIIDTTVRPAANRRHEGAAIILDRYRDPYDALRAPGIGNQNDRLSALMDWQLPDNYLQGFSNNAQRRGYGFPPDLRGFSALGLDFYGQPLTAFAGYPNEPVDDPYEMNTGSHFRDILSPYDSPYTVGELERILRFNDIDAAELPDRLVRLALDTFRVESNRRRVTVRSSHIPVLSSVAFAGERIAPGTQTILNNYYQRIAESVATPGQNPDPVRVFQVMSEIVPAEILRGERFDINRPFGNGRDDNNNGIVDEPAELFLPEGSRALFARHLYCLMMLLMGRGGNGDILPAKHGTDDPPLVAQRIAQFCVNVVDYRDPDSIMTRFVYDSQPFDGWDVSDSSATRGEVWGCESPDLLITETLAFHDRRVKDTAFDSTQKRRNAPNPLNRDDDVDQYRIPQGSLFLELHCPRTANALLPRELYTPTGNLDLGRTDVNGFPVWRVVISDESAPLVERPEDPSATRSPSGETFEPRDADIDRIIWFAPVAAHGPDAAKVFYGRTPNPQVEPNGYVVVGPRPVTHIGSRRGGADGDPLTWDWAPSAQRLVMGPPFQAFNINNALLTPNAHIRPPLSIICAADPPPTWVAGGPINTIGMNISEPLPQDPAGNYYPQPNPGNNAYPQDPPDAYDDTANPAYSLPDGPLDQRPGMPLQGRVATGSDPALRRSAYLQRLADPSQPWEPTVNPYKTVDWTTIDLTVFNGEENNDEFEPDEWLDPDDKNPLNTFPDELFHSRQRDGAVASFSGRATFNAADRSITRMSGRTFMAAGFRPGQQLLIVATDELVTIPTVPQGIATPPNRGLHIIQSVTNNVITVAPLPSSPLVNDLVDNAKPQVRLYAYTGNRLSPSTKEPWESVAAQTMNPATVPYWDFNLNHTLGYLNEGMGMPNVSHPNYAGAPSLPFDWLNWMEQLPPSSPTSIAYQWKPFPWLPWMDRPFVSAYELMDVPASSPSRLLYEFSAWNVPGRFYNIPPAGRLNPYTDTANPTPNPFAQFYGGHAHLLNFLHSGDVADANEKNAFYKLFEAVHVPSRFVGTTRWYDQSPFNKLSRFRDPGRVNINTLLPDSTNPIESRVWEGIAKLFPEMDTKQTGSQMLERMMLSRQGYGNASGDLFRLSSTAPTMFGNPFRSAAHADMVSRMTPGLAKPAIDATFLRRDVKPHLDPGNNNFWGGGDDLSRIEPLFVADASVHHHLRSNTRNQDTNSFQRHQVLHRIGSLLSTNSNVFAIWVTVGYFELEENTVRVVGGNARTFTHPDGLMLGAELGLETGEIRRNRFFYIVDRSIPCAFEPGVNHNIENMILLRRSIE